MNGVKKLTGRMSFAEDIVTLDLSAVRVKGKKKKGAEAAPETIAIPLKEIERAQLVSEF